MKLPTETIAKNLRKWAIAAALFVISTVTGGFILALCDDAGWFKHPWEKVAQVIAFAHWLTGSPWVHWIGGGIIGFAIGVWLDAFVRRSGPTPQFSAHASGKQSSSASVDPATLLFRQEIRIFVLSHLNEMVNCYTKVTSAVWDSACGTDKGGDHAAYTHEFAAAALQDGLLQPFQRLRMMADRDPNTYDLKTLTYETAQFLQRYIERHRLPQGIAKKYGVPLNQKGHPELSTKAWRASQERVRLQLNDLKVSPWANDLTNEYLGTGLTVVDGT